MRDARPSVQNAFRRIRTLPTFADSLCSALLQVSEFARSSRTASPCTHHRPRQRIVASFGLGRAPRLALRLPAIARREMRPNQLLPPNTFSTTSTRASWIPDCRVTRLSPRADRGTERFTTPDSLRRAVRLFFVGGRCLPQASPGFSHLGHEPYDRTSGTSVASPPLTEWRLRTHWSSSGPPRLHSPRVREDHTMSTTRDAFHR